MPKDLIPILSLMIVWLGLNQSAVFAFVPCLIATLNEALQMADVGRLGKRGASMAFGNHEQAHSTR